MDLFNYERPGPGVEENTPPKRGIFKFLEVLWRKFYPLLKVNIVYTLVSIPFMLILWFAITPQYVDVFFSRDMVNENSLQYFFVNTFVTGILLNYLGSGPVSVAYAFVARSFTKSEPIFIFSDGRDKFRENFKQSLILVVIDIVVMFVLGIALRFYLLNDSMLALVSFYLMLTLVFIYMASHIFMYQIMITFDCSIINIIKNSLVLTFAKLPMCILLMAITGVIYILMNMYLGFWAILLYMTIGMHFTRFPLEFYATRVIEKNIKKGSS